MTLASYKSRHIGHFVLFLLVAIGGAIILFIDYTVAQKILSQWRTSTYLETVGTVTHSRVELIDKETHIRIHYDYVVNGEQYTGTEYRHVHMILSGSAAHRILSEYPVGKVVPVYHCPDQPQQAVLCKGLGTQDLPILLFLLPFNGVLLIGIYGLLKSMCRRFFRNEHNWFRDFPIRDDGVTIRLRVSLHDPIPATIIGTFSTCIIALLLFWLAELDIDPLSVLAGGIVLGGVFGFWNAVRLNRSDLYTLTVDKTYSELTLPRQPDKTPGPVVPFDAIEAITLSVTRRESKDERDNHILTLYYRSGNETKSAIVVSNHNWIEFFNFREGNVEQELMELKNWILRETGKVV